jgi:hypothetical protein
MILRFWAEDAVSKPDPVASRKRRLARCQIAIDDVAHIFSDGEIKSIIEQYEAKRIPGQLFGLLKNEERFRRFANGVREAAKHGIQMFGVASDRELRDAIVHLHSAASSNKLSADHFEGLSDITLDWLTRRHQTRGDLVRFPTADDLRDPSRRRTACELLASLCVIRGWVQDGKMQWEYYAPVIPETEKRADRRGPEAEFVAALRHVWLVTFEMPPASSASASAKGPFVEFVDACFELMLGDECNASATEIINKLNEHTKETKRQLIPSSIVQTHQVHLRRDGPRVELLNREAVDLTARFPHIVAAAAALPAQSFAIDGDMTVVGPNGCSVIVDPATVSATETTVMTVLDLCRLDGEDLTTMAPRQRWKRLSAH